MPQVQVHNVVFNLCDCASFSSGLSGGKRTGGNAMILTDRQLTEVSVAHVKIINSDFFLFFTPSCFLCVCLFAACSQHPLPCLKILPSKLCLRLCHLPIPCNYFLKGLECTTVVTTLMWIIQSKQTTKLPLFAFGMNTLTVGWVKLVDLGRII